MSRPLRAVLLDALGTLLELEPPAPFLREELLRRHGVKLDETDAQRAIAAEIGFYRRHFDEGHDEETLLALRVRCAAALIEALPEKARRGLPAPEAVVEALLASLRFRAFPDVPAALARLRRRGLALLVVSNWDISLHERLDELGLTPQLDAVLTSAEAGARKPSPAIFQQALELAGANAVEAIHVGDSVEEDVAGAVAAGIEPVLVVRGRGQCPPGVREISSLAQLP